MFQALIPLITSALGAWAASQANKNNISAEKLQYIQPTLTPQQQGMQNLLYYLTLSKLYGQDTGNQDLLSQYIYGTNTGIDSTALNQGDIGTSNIISGYQQQVAGAEQTEANLKKTEQQLRYETLTPVLEYGKEMSKLSIEDRNSKKNEISEYLKKQAQQLSDLTALPLNESYFRVSELYNSTMPYEFKTTEDTLYSIEQVRAYAEKNGLIIPEDLGMEEDKSTWQNYEKNFIFPNISSVVNETGAGWDIAPKVSTLRFAKNETSDQFYNDIKNELESQNYFDTAGTEGTTAGTEGTTAGTEGTTAGEEGILSQLMDKDWIAQQIGLARESGMEDISDWYNQAMREMEQRGISQGGGLLGTGYEKDVGSLLGKRGELESSLNRELNTMQIATERQDLYDILNALMGLQTLESQINAASTTPLINAALASSTAPYGTSTTITSPNQNQVGVIPGALSGLYTGMGIYGMGQNYGWWGNNTTSTPSTAYGAGSSGLNLSGTQNLWNQYSGNNLWY